MAFRQLGVPSYWVIDPLVPRLTAFELNDEDEYELIAKASGPEVFEAQRPFPVSVVPAELLPRKRP
ncbi:Uma2 family endonuclease [Saccharopolyspora taberi]|uniref:Putative restriction endonuclease domain-containing protein n=1 Tax=Saccharopolyspora taberi TaxID=60895 RepID=A0ABN3V360_9PSEU